MSKILLLLGSLSLLSFISGRRHGHGSDQRGSEVCDGEGWRNIQGCSCTCKDSGTYEWQKKARTSRTTEYKKKYPCNGSSNIDSCTCRDGIQVNGTDSIRECGGWKNFPKTCECVDGTTWTKPPSKWYPCTEKANIESCTCKDGTEVTGTDAIKGCGGYKNKPNTCQCVDGTTWTKPVKPKRPAPCNAESWREGWKMITGCSCDCRNGANWSWSKTQIE